MKLLAIRYCGNRSTAKGASEDRLAHLSICWRRTPGRVHRDCLPAAMDDRVGWRKRTMRDRLGSIY